MDTSTIGLQEIYPAADWRLLVHPPMNGPLNMAIDETIGEHVGAGLVPPTLRFYGWDPACLSLGYTQPAADVNFEQLGAHGWDIVRRLTGGRAILHIDELTYSIVVPKGDPRVTDDVVESYRRLSQGLVAGLLILDAPVRADAADQAAHRFKGPVCFEVPSDYEITVAGRKLLGSAQTRRRGIVLQHGALPLYGNLTRICDVLAFESEAERNAARKRLAARAVTLEEALGRRIDESVVIRALAQGFAEVLNLRLEEGQLGASEMERAEELFNTRYATAEWTCRR